MYKQLIIVRKDLEMSPGKAAAQVAHASNMFLINMIKSSVKPVPGEGYEVANLQIDKDIYDKWLNDIYTKIICGAKNKNQLMKAIDIANNLGLTEGEDFFIIKDRCLTELEPEETDKEGNSVTTTCIGFRPLPVEITSQISKKYQLYK